VPEYENGPYLIKTIEKNPIYMIGFQRDGFFLPVTMMGITGKSLSNKVFKDHYKIIWKIGMEEGK
jgi:hypothetical protein